MQEPFFNSKGEIVRFGQRVGAGGGVESGAGGDVEGEEMGSALLLGGLYAARRVAMTWRGVESGSDPRHDRDRTTGTIRTKSAKVLISDLGVRQDFKKNLEEFH